MYVVVVTRPDIASAVGVVSQYMANPVRLHWEAVKHILMYLKDTIGRCLCFENSDASSIMVYADADYAGCVDNRRLTYGYVFIFIGAAVSWKSCLQGCTLSSTTKTEYISLSDASKEAI
ncbi:hypothetical protein L7F22_005071 [Adiantum nelumboides]|nr:hypothetical protein [Adiantum nelumboides]